MLQKKYFTPFSMIRIIEYFVKSRLSYGVSCFLDIESEIRKLHLVLIQHIKSLFGLPINTSHKRLQLVLGEPDIQVSLAVRLLKNWHKYCEHYGEEPEKLKPALKKYFTDEELAGPCDYKALKVRLTHNNLLEINKSYPEHKIRFNHREFLNKYVFTHPDKRDFYLIRFFTNTTKGTSARLFPKCVCGEDNEAKHGLDDCKLLLNETLRLEYRSKAIELLSQAGVSLTKRETLYELCSIAFFTVVPRENGSNQSIRKMIELMKKLIFELVISFGEEPKGDSATL